jgi:hypothetical protein
LLRSRCLWVVLGQLGFDRLFADTEHLSDLALQRLAAGPSQPAVDDHFDAARGPQTAEVRLADLA